MRHRPILRAAVAGLAYFGIVFAIAFGLGILRISVANPLLGKTLAVIIELAILLTLAWKICRVLVARFQVPTPLNVRLLMGAVAFIVLMLAEISGSTPGFNRTLAEHFQQYREIAGILGLAGQIAFATFPAIQSIIETRSRA